MTSVLSKIVNGAITVWDDAETEIESLEAKIVNAVPALAPDAAALTTAVKQGASDALGAASTMLGTAAKPLSTGIESAADAALTALLKGGAVVLTPIVNNAIDVLVDQGIATLQSWALSAKASISGVTVVPPSPIGTPAVLATSAPSTPSTLS